MTKRKIFVVDDEKDFTKLLQMNLVGTGKYEVLTANEGKKALSAIRKFKPDLVLLDIMMPDMDGGEVAYRLESDEELKNIPVVFLTAVISKGEDTSQTALAKRHPILAKPVTIEELDSCIERVLRK